MEKLRSVTTSQIISFALEHSPRWRMIAGNACFTYLPIYAGGDEAGQYDVVEEQVIESEPGVASPAIADTDQSEELRNMGQVHLDPTLAAAG